MKMSGLSKALPFVLALAAAVLTISCGSNSTSSNLAQIRVLNAISDGPTLDITANGSKIITNLPFATIQPATTPATYVGVAAGNVLIQGLSTGSTTNPIAPIGTISLASTKQYTVVAVGPALNESPPLLLQDDNTTAVGTDVKFRFINASPGSPLGGLDIYIVAPGVIDLTNYSPQISALSNAQASQYQTVPAAAYNVIITQNGTKTPALITLPFTANDSSITTIVMLDNIGGVNGMSNTPLVLNDLN